MRIETLENQVVQELPVFDTRRRVANVRAAFEHSLEDNLIRLQENLAEERYQPGAYASFTIHEPEQWLAARRKQGER